MCRPRSAAYERVSARLEHAQRLGCPLRRPRLKATETCDRAVVFDLTRRHRRRSLAAFEVWIRAPGIVEVEPVVCAKRFPLVLSDTSRIERVPLLAHESDPVRRVGHD